MAVTGSKRRYPSLSLEKSIDRIRVIHDAERRAVTPMSVIAKNIGYKSPNTGPASTAISALKQYGLLSDNGVGEQRTGQVTELAWVIITTPDPSERLAAIRQAAMLPTAMREAREHYADGIGSDANFEWSLQRDLGFSAPGAADFARVYRANVAFAQLDDAEGASADGVDEELSRSGHQDEDRVQHVELSREARGQENAPLVGAAASSSPAAGLEVSLSAEVRSRHVIPLVGGKQVILEGEFPISEQAWQGFIAVLQAFKPGLVSSSPDAPSGLAVEDSTV